MSSVVCRLCVQLIARQRVFSSLLCLSGVRIPTKQTVARSKHEKSFYHSNIFFGLPFFYYSLFYVVTKKKEGSNVITHTIELPW